MDSIKSSRIYGLFNIRLVATRFWIPRVITTALVGAAFLVGCGGGGGSGGGGDSPPTVPAPTVTITSSASSVPVNSTVTLTWSSQTATTCIASGTWSGTKATSASETVTVGAHSTYSLSCSGSGGSAQASVSVSATPVNVAPVANAGSDQSVLVGATVTLDGSGSTDANGDSLSYQWTLTSVPPGSSAALSDVAAVRPTYVVDVVGSYTASLIVSDGRLSSPADAITVTAAALNAVPVANAGADQSVSVGTVVTLDGSASSDANGDALNYQWALTVRPAGSTAVLSDTGAVKPTFMADVAGSYTATLTVRDGKSTSAPDTVSVVASTVNAAPVANAGPDQSVVTGSVVTLDGSASTDADGDVLRYRWSLTAVPSGSRATLSDSAVSRPTFTPDLDGTYVASLVVSDGTVDSNVDTVAITSARANAAPIANAGSDQSVYKLATVTLDGSQSSDPDGDSITYQWTAKSFPGFFAPSLSGGTTAKPRFLTSDVGDYVFDLVVRDGGLTSAADSVTVTVLNGVGPTPAGTELVVASGANMFVIREQTMTKYIDFYCGVGFWGLDQAPNGVLLATTDSQLYEINAQTGACVARGNTPEWIEKLAVSPSGQLYGVGFTLYSDAQGLLRRLYRLSSSGAAEGYVEFSGASRFVYGIDFGPDGVLYGIAIANGAERWIVTIEPSTGVTALVAQVIPKPDGDIDIDGNSVMRYVSVDNLIKYDLIGKAVISTTPIPGYFSQLSGISAIVYVP